MSDKGATADVLNFQQGQVDLRIGVLLEPITEADLESGVGARHVMSLNAQQLIPGSDSYEQANNVCLQLSGQGLAVLTDMVNSMNKGFWSGTMQCQTNIPGVTLEVSGIKNRKGITAISLAVRYDTRDRDAQNVASGNYYQIGSSTRSSHGAPKFPSSVLKWQVKAVQSLLQDVEKVTGQSCEIQWGKELSEALEGQDLSDPQALVKCKARSSLKNPSEWRDNDHGAMDVAKYFSGKFGVPSAQGGGPVYQALNQGMRNLSLGTSDVSRTYQTLIPGVSITFSASVTNYGPQDMRPSIAVDPNSPAATEAYKKERAMAGPSIGGRQADRRGVNHQSVFGGR